MRDGKTRRPCRGGRRVFLSLLSATVFSVLVCSVVVAAWSAAGSGAGATQSVSMPVGPFPAVEVNGDVVILRWQAVHFFDGTAVEAYRVRRYDVTSGAEAGAGGTCAGTVRDLECQDTAVPSGSWQYTLTALHKQWVGDEGDPSAASTLESGP